MKRWDGTGNEIEWEIVSDYWKRCIDCEQYIKDETKNMPRKEKARFIEEHHEGDNCNNHTHLYQNKKSKLWHDSNNNYCYAEHIPKDWITKGKYYV